MPLRDALISGAAGAGVLTLAHESLRRIAPNPPRMDRLGRQGFAKLLRFPGRRVPSRDELQLGALAGDLASNSAYYSLVGVGDRRGAWTRGLLLGALAGVGAILLPRRLGLSSRESNRTNATRWMTFLLYVVGGVAAAAAHSANVTRR